MDLANVFYITGIVGMGLLTIVMLGILIAVAIIARKVSKIHKSIQEKLAPVTNAAHVVQGVVAKVKDKFSK